MAFEGKVVIVTGSSSGIGQAAAVGFAKEGAKIVIHGQNVDRLKKTAERLRLNKVAEQKIFTVVGAIQEEKTQKQLIDDTVKKFGRLDVLVNNAGLSHRSDLNPNSNENLDYVMDVNLKSVISLTRLAVPHLEKTKGNIVNVSSIGAHCVLPELVPYILTKAALDLYTRNAAIQYIDQGIRINTVSPGVTSTAFATRHDLPEDGMDQFTQHHIDTVVPMHRLGTPEEVANVIEFLASDKASYCTGSVFVVDGGALAGPPQSTGKAK